MNKLLLKLIMLPAGIWKGLGADTVQLEAILDVRLKMDDRKPISFGRQGQQKKEHKYSSLLNSFFSLIMGFVYIIPLLSFPDRVLGLWGYFSLFLFMSSFLLITDFSNVLIDTRDKTILLPRPVNDRTLFLSRLLHVFVYLFRILLPMSIPGWIVLGMAEGWKAVLWFPIPLLLLIFIALFLVNGFYLMLLKFAKPEKFKEILSYFQIFISIIVFACCYILPKVMNSVFVEHLSIDTMGWIRYMPSYWLAACWGWLHPDAGLQGTLWLSTLAVLFPVVCLFVTVRYLAPQFAQNMGALDAGIDHVPDVKIKTIAASSRKPFYKKIADMLNRRDEAKAGFMITWLQTSRSRAFKMRVLPSLAYVPIYFFYLLLQKKQPFAEVWADLPHSHINLTLLYMSSFVMMQALNYVNMSEQYKAAWVYYAMPLDKPGYVMGGAFKAILSKYFLPFFTIIAVFVLSVWGINAITDILLALTNVTLFALLLQLAMRHLPFSQMDQVSNAGGRTLRTLFAFGVAGLMGVGHYFTLNFWMLKLLFFILSAIALWFVWDSYSKTSWQQVKAAE